MIKTSNSLDNNDRLARTSHEDSEIKERLRSGVDG